MTISSQIAALQTIHRAIAGVTSAPDGTNTYQVPSSVNSVDLPMVLLEPTTTDITPLTQTSTDQINVYAGAVLVAASAQGVGVTESVVGVWTLASALAARYSAMLAADERIDSNTALVMRYQAQNEPSEITYRGADWIGFTFTVTVWSIT